jgi:hypothetical protein
MSDAATTKVRPLTEAELESIRSRARAGTADLWESLAHDVPALLAALDEAANLIHDLQQESWAYQRGEEDGLRKAAELVRDGKGDIGDVIAHGANAGIAMAILRLCGSAAPPPPPDQVRAENARLRAALREVAHTPIDPIRWQEVAREALGEDAT